MKNQPIKLSPAFKDYLWGGRRLVTEYNKKSDLERVAESWELSNHKDGESIVETGEFRGMTFGEYIKENDVIGKRAREFEFFPILIKFIDAKDNLSIQVHPDDEYSLKNNGEYGKTEMWYVMDCEEGASLYYGFNREITCEEFKKRIEENTLLEVLNEVKVKKGDVFFIKSGMVHAIGKGIMICEIQQNSNTTYRVYDYARRGADGKLRPLHIEQAIAVADLCPPAEGADLPENTIAKCEYFTVEKYTVKGELLINTDENSFKSVIVLSGEGMLGELDLKKGDSVFIPAGNDGVILKGDCEVIISYV